MVPGANVYSGRVPVEPTFSARTTAGDARATVGLAHVIRDAAAQQLATPREQFTNFFGATVFRAKNPNNVSNRRRDYGGTLPSKLLPILDVPAAWLQPITGKGG